MVEKSSIIRTAGFVIAAGIVTGLTLGAVRDCNEKKRYAALVEERTDVLRKCKFSDRVRDYGHCLSPSAESKRAKEAKEAEEKGDYRTAGMKYAEIGHRYNDYMDKAYEMAGRCKKKGDKKGREAILKEIKLREESVARARKGLSGKPKGNVKALAKDESLEETKDSTAIKPKLDAGPMVEGPMDDAGVPKPDAAVKVEEPVEEETMAAPTAMGARGKPRKGPAPMSPMGAPKRAAPMAAPMDAPAMEPSRTAPRRPAEMDREIPLD